MEYKSISTSYNENLSPGEYVRRYQYISDRAMVLCSCGHEVPSSQVMNASRGTACPDCYDRMSD